MTEEAWTQVTAESRMFVSSLANGDFPCFFFIIVIYGRKKNNTEATQESAE